MAKRDLKNKRRVLLIILLVHIADLNLPSQPTGNVGNFVRHRNAKRLTTKPFASHSHKMRGYGLDAANLLVINHAVPKPWFKFRPWQSCLLSHVHAPPHCHDTAIEQ